MFLSTPNLRRLFATLLPGIVAAVTTMAQATQATVLPSAQVLASATLPFLPRSPGDDARVAFTARMFAGTLFVTAKGELVYRLRAPRASTDANVADWVIVETFAGASLTPRGAAAGNAKASRMLGDDPARWQPDLPAFERVALGEAWPGIAIELSARARSVEKRFVLAPGADPHRITVRLKGARRISRSGDGTLRVDTGHGPVQFGAPVAWQDIDGERRPVAVRYTIAEHRYGFALGPYDRSQALVIDPLLQTTYGGGSGGDIAYAMAIDAAGGVLVAGSTLSVNFPGTQGGAQTVAAGGGDAFVAKLNRELTSYEQVTYLGGSAVDSAQALAIAADGTVLVAGNTSSVNFPGTAAGAQPNPGGNGDGFVATLSADLRNLLAATYLGGSATDRAWAMTIGIDDRILVAGDTASANFPGTAGGAQPVRASGGDAFVASLDASLSKITQSTYLGGSNNDVAYAIARDAADNVFVAGTTGSTNFPGTTGGAQPLAAGGGDAFVARLSPSLKTLTQATFLGGTQLDVAYALALHPDGSVYVAGDTASANFPGTTGGAQPARGGSVDAFVAKFDASLSKLKQATYFGGLSDESGAAIALDGGGGVYLAGSTRSSALPATALGAQSNPGGGGDAFAARFNDALDVLTQATYLGGSGLDQGFALALDGRGHVYVAGGTASFNLPSATGGAQPAAGGGGDLFVGKLTASLALVDPPAIEYFHAEWDHYFVTADSNEIGKLDSGVFAGWARTGQSFKVAPLDTRGVVPVCRFFSVSFAPRSSHFYTPYADECAQVKLNPDWQFEGEVFAVALPDTDGGCPVRMLPLYRLYNNGQGGAPNHRYTTSLATRSQMLQQGWIPEGAGALGVMGCVTE